MVKVYLNTLKTNGNYTYTEISNLSGIPEATIRKIFSGETADPRFDTIAKLVTAMGGSMDKILVDDDKPDIEQIGKLETDVIEAVKDIYESRISDVKEYLQSLKRDKRILAITTGALMAFVVFLLIFDLSFGSHGWIQY